MIGYYVTQYGNANSEGFGVSGKPVSFRMALMKSTLWPCSNSFDLSSPCVLLVFLVTCIGSLGSLNCHMA